MQVLTRADGTIEPIGSVNHAELAKLRAAAKKRKASDDKPDDSKSDDSKPVAEQKSESTELKGASVTTADVAPAAAPATPPKPATRKQ